MVYIKQLLIVLTASSMLSMCTKDDSDTCKTPTPEVNLKKNGISLVAPRNPITNEDLLPLYNIKPNWVSLMPFGFMRSNDPNLNFNVPNQWWGEREEGVKEMANLLKNQHIKIMLKPQIWVYDINQYTGHIEMSSEEDWKTFETKYRDFALFYAQLAEEVNIEMFCIGTELEKFVIARPDFWRALIKDIRSVYSGSLTYASNWDEYKRVGFWDLLDEIGVDAYFPVSDIQHPTESDISKGWQTHIQTLKLFSETNEKPILFTEYGYRSMEYCGKEPWDSGNGFATSLEAQSNAYHGFFNSVYKEEWLSGGFVWKWFTDHTNSGGANNNRFTMQNKPSEQILKQHFSNY